mgnify:CR=1 FL=1|tara:strand:+ start:3361 stop:3753 length:393 start_codon:yes stop_codon:yes gene_type:complete
MKRNIQDAQFNEVIALPAAGSTANSASIDMVEAGGLEESELLVGHPVLPVLVDAKTVTIKIQDSADDSTFADIVGLSTLVTTGAGGSGAAANSRAVRLPSTTRQFVRISTIVLAAGGDNTAVEAFLQLRF